MSPGSRVHPLPSMSIASAGSGYGWPLLTETIRPLSESNVTVAFDKWILRQIA